MNAKTILNLTEIDAIINLRKAFNGNVQQLRDVLHTCNECPNSQPHNIDLTKVDFEFLMSSLVAQFNCMMK